jgi:hypothetical protein
MDGRCSENGRGDVEYGKLRPRFSQKDTLGNISFRYHTSLRISTPAVRGPRDYFTFLAELTLSPMISVQSESKCLRMV